MPVDPSAYVAPTARVHPDAVIGPQSRIGEYCVIEQDVVLGAGCLLEPYVYIKRWTTMGDHNEISAGAVLGTDPFDKVFTGERSYLKIGHRNRIREHWTISRGTAPESTTVVGDGNYVMGSGHIAHNCVVGSNAVIASCSLLAGYVVLEDGAFVSGGVGVHQYCRIGSLAMVAGGTRVNQDLVPYFMYSGLYATPHGLNLVGLRRAGFTGEQVGALKRAYKTLFKSGLKLEEALQRIEAAAETIHTMHLVEFIRGSKRGISRE